ncbi:MAG: hypothetical protein Q4G70_01300 [Pseudomonadota bacterium]|nr:hypothetical protein [Pseudomonadota bacterium]
MEQLLRNGCRYFHDGSHCSDLDLICIAVDQLMARGLNPADVAYVIHAHTQAFSAPAAPVSVLSQLAQRYGWRTHMSFSVTHLACAAVGNAIQWAADLLRQDARARYALVVTSDRVFGQAGYRIYQNSGMQSDGGSAILIGRESLLGVLDRVTVLNYTQLFEGPSDAANIAAIARLTWLQTKKLFQQHAQDCGLPVDQMGTLLTINAALPYWKLIAKSLGLGMDQFFLDNIGKRGHAYCADFAVNMADEGVRLLSEGQRVVYCAQSNVGAYAAIGWRPPS